VDSDAKKFYFEIFTPDGIRFQGDVNSVTLPAIDGYMGILAGRAPVTAIVTTGTVSIQKTDGGTEENWFVSHGFCQMSQNHLTLLAEESKPLAELDPEHAWELLQRAYKMPKDTTEQRTIRDQVIHNCRIRFNLAQKAKKAKAGGMMDFNSLMSPGGKTE